ncbi:hypothetical protein L6452_31050 [Arctium lappa]|uniref:Uncharacterized protein n=1 Tax=Arctium lappa TaxID=4217 RepID=A0ACB8ZKU5_ARCLA|nr:hypothetical protein L6452_31050 [Arctium lappa]
MWQSSLWLRSGWNGRTHRPPLAGNLKLQLRCPTPLTPPASISIALISPLEKPSTLPPPCASNREKWDLGWRCYSKPKSKQEIEHGELGFSLFLS